MRERDDRLAGSQAGQAKPQTLVDTAHRALQGGYNLRVGDLVQDVAVDQAEDLAWQVLGKLRNEDQSKPALAATLGNARYLLEQDGHLLDSLVAQELMCLFDHDQHTRRCLEIRIAT